MNTGIVIELICFSAMFGVMGGAMGHAGYAARQARKAKAKAKAEKIVEPLRWTVEAKPKGGYRYLDDDGKAKGDSITCIVVSCVRKGSPSVQIGRHDAGAPDVQKEIAKLEEKAEEHCTTLNAMDLARDRGYDW